MYYDAKRWATSMLYDIKFRRDFDTATASTPLLDLNGVKGEYGGHPGDTSSLTMMAP